MVFLWVAVLLPKPFTMAGTVRARSRWAAAGHQVLKGYRTEDLKSRPEPTWFFHRDPLGIPGFEQHLLVAKIWRFSSIQTGNNR